MVLQGHCSQVRTWTCHPMRAVLLGAEASFSVWPLVPYFCEPHHPPRQTTMTSYPGASFVLWLTWAGHSLFYPMASRDCCPSPSSWVYYLPCLLLSGSLTTPFM